MKPTIVSTARLDATSPAECPPIPSATTKSWRPSSLAKLSSFVFRTGPMSVAPYALSTLSSFNGGMAEKPIADEAYRAGELWQYYFSSTPPALVVLLGQTTDELSPRIDPDFVENSSQMAL